MCMTPLFPVPLATLGAPAREDMPRAIEPIVIRSHDRQEIYDLGPLRLFDQWWLRMVATRQEHFMKRLVAHNGDIEAAQADTRAWMAQIMDGQRVEGDQQMPWLLHRGGVDGHSVDDTGVTAHVE